MNESGHVFWLFGLSGAGKSTLACFLGQQLRRHSLSPPLMLDGDRVRSGLCSDLGFSDDDRSENLRRSSEVARIAVESGINVVASFITPREAHRQLVERTIGRTQVSLIHVSASLKVCQARDVKGLYLKAERGVLPQMPGVDSVFDFPGDCDLVLDTESSPVSRSGADLLSFAMRRVLASPRTREPRAELRSP